jgi:membrane protein involved in colicin uptake
MDDIDKFIESYQKAKADKKAEDEAAAEKAKRDAKNKADAGKKKFRHSVSFGWAW